MSRNENDKSEAFMTYNDRLSEYEKKRNLDESPEPARTGRARSMGPIFLIQQHDASSHHYDLRIEIDGGYPLISTDTGDDERWLLADQDG
jgi:hypothetical protein